LAGRFTKDDLTWQFANFFGNIADVDGRAILIPRESAYLSYTILFGRRCCSTAASGSIIRPKRTIHPARASTSPNSACRQPAQPEPKRSGSQAGLLPRLGVSDLTTFGGTNASANHSVSGTASATVSKILGAQTLKAGYEYRLYQRNVFGINSPVGNYSFNRGFTQGPNPSQASATSGYSVASCCSAHQPARRQASTPPAPPR